MKCEVFLTIFSGIVVFSISQLIMETIIKPRVKLKELKGKVYYCLTLYANLIANPFKLYNDINLREKEEYINTSKEIRIIASEFSGHLSSHPIVSQKKKYSPIVNKLIALSNGLFEHDIKHDIATENSKIGKEICEILKVDNIF